MGTHGFQMITFLLEKGYKGMLFLWLSLSYAGACSFSCGGYLAMLKAMIMVPLVPVLMLMVSAPCVCSAPLKVQLDPSTKLTHNIAIIKCKMLRLSWNIAVPPSGSGMR